MTTINFQLQINGILTDATSVVLSDPTNTFGVRRTDTLATVVAAGTALVHLGTGVYEYTFADPADGLTYNYWVEWVYGGNTFRVEQNKSGPASSGIPGPAVIAPALPQSAVSLARYAELAEQNECYFWGVFDEHYDGDACNPIWTNAARNLTARYLAEAEDEIEQVIGYPLMPKWIEAEQQPLRNMHVHARWMEVLAAGARATSTIASGTSIDHTNDPAVIGPIATVLTDTSEIHVYYPGSQREITPLSIQIAGGTLTILIPRCRLVASDHLVNPAGGWDYNDLSNFLSTVDIMRVYNDPTVQGTLVYPHRSSECSCGHRTCGEATATACVYVKNGRLGALDVLRADESGGTWTVRCPRCWGTRPQLVRLNYYAGLTALTPRIEDAIIRLAHSRMPAAPCGCGPIQEMWARDRNVPAVLDTERLNCPFGLSDGAWQAWKLANSLQHRRLSVM